MGYKKNKTKNKMSLEKKLGIYLTFIILLVFFGFCIMLYPFEYYEKLDKLTEPEDTILLTIVFATKALGILLLFIGSEIYSKHFKKKA